MADNRFNNIHPDMDRGESREQSQNINESIDGQGVALQELDQNSDMRSSKKFKGDQSDNHNLSQKDRASKNQMAVSEADFYDNEGVVSKSIEAFSKPVDSKEEELQQLKEQMD